jgi:hypothetical protein
MITQYALYKGEGKRMTALKIEAFKQEFSWIETCLGKDCPVSQAYVSRVEPSLLEHTLLKIQVADFFADFSCLEQIFFINERGEKIEIKRPFSRRKYRFFGPVITGWIFSHSLPKDFSIGEAIEEMGNRSDQIRYILSYHPYTDAVIVYKSPKGMTIREWVASQMKIEREAVQAACAEIDKEAQALLA